MKIFDEKRGFDTDIFSLKPFFAKRFFLFGQKSLFTSTKGHQLVNQTFYLAFMHISVHFIIKGLINELIIMR